MGKSIGIWLIGLGLVGALVTFYFFGHFAGLSFKDIQPSDLGKSLAWLILFALFVERATEVFLNIKQPVDRTDLETAIVSRDAARVTAEVARKSLATEADVSAVRARHFALARAESDVRKEKTTLENARRPYAVVISMVLGLGIAMVGGRVLSSFVNLQDVSECVPAAVSAEARAVLDKAVEAMSGDQKTVAEAFLQNAYGLQACEVLKSQHVWLATIDVPITAALLAGGADGLHQIVNRFVGYFKADATV